jgi:hypothetical protein
VGRGMGGTKMLHNRVNGLKTGRTTFLNKKGTYRGSNGVFIDRYFVLKNKKR